MENIKNYFKIEERSTVLLALFIFVAAVALTVIHYSMSRKKIDMKYWRIACMVPIVLSVVHLVIHRFTGDVSMTLTLYAAMYGAAILIGLWQFAYKTGRIYTISAVIVNIGAVGALAATLLIPLAISPAIHNFTRMNYAEAMKSTIEAMKEEYVLSDWKGTDFDMIEDKVMPLAELADEENNPGHFYTAMVTYAYYFYDRHVIPEALKPETVKYITEAKENLAGNDYGMSMCTLDNGDTIAILVEPQGEAYKAGIRNGTTITTWDGVMVEEAVKDVQCIYPDLSFAVKENEDFFRPVFLAGKGGNTVEVGFVDENGNEGSTLLKATGSYKDRLDIAIYRFTYQDKMRLENFECRMLTDTCGYMRISEEFFSFVKDAVSMVTGKYPALVKHLDKELGKLKEQGMETLVIDLRNNVGGVDDISSAVVSMFTDETFFAHGIGVYEDGEYKVNEKHYVYGNGRYKDIEVAVLVNFECCSAGDNMAYNFAKIDNATIMGLTVSSGVDQNMGGLCVMPDSDFSIRYPAGLVLAEEGYPLIDTDESRKSNIELDVKIPFDYEAAIKIFANGTEDYELQYAIEYMEKDK